MNSALQLRLLDLTPMLFHSLSYCPSVLNVLRHLLIRLDLRWDEPHYLLCQSMRDADNAIQISDNNVAGMYRSVLVLTL